MRVLAALAACVLVAGCSSPAAEDEPTPRATSATAATDLHVECAGDGGPTVVLIAGLDTAGDTFDDLQSRLAATARTCSYDRAGIGDSPPLADDAPDPSPGSAAADLRTALAAEGIDPPYVVLGWSYGGLVAQAYAVDFPEDLAGLVLEDTSIRAQFESPDDSWVEGGRTVDAAAVLDQLAEVDLGDLPVAVLSQELQEAWQKPWYLAHDRLARATTDGVHAVAVGSGHVMHEDVPRVVARAVEAVWVAASSGAGLPACRTVFRGEQVRCRV